jgi:hypothetical protein
MLISAINVNLNLNWFKANASVTTVLILMEKPAKPAVEAVSYAQMPTLAEAATPKSTMFLLTISVNVMPQATSLMMEQIAFVTKDISSMQILARPVV